MKFWKLLLVFSIMLLSPGEVIAQTYYYSTTRTFVENGYTYQCDVPEWKIVTLYNKTNQYTYQDMYYKNSGNVYRYNGKNSTMEPDTRTKPQCYSIVNNAFSPTERQRVKGNELRITLIISPETGRIIEVNFGFHYKKPLATIPISVYRKMELDFKQNVWFTPTAEGKKLNYIMRSWRQKMK